MDLRPFDDDDADAVFEMMRDPDAVRQAAFTADDRVTMLVVTADGGFAGTAASLTVDGDREVTYWITRHARGRGVASAALRLLVAREAERPLYARVAADNEASIAVLRKNGFSEIRRQRAYAPARGEEIDELVFALPPTLDGI